MTNYMSSSIYHFFGLLFVIAFTFTITTHKFNAYKSQDTYINNPTAAEVEKTLQCLAINIYREGATEPFEGKVGIAQVTLNRVNHHRFPKDICSVVYQKNIIMEKVICQFSWYCDSIVRSKPINTDAYNESMAVAKKVLLEGFRLDVLQEALYYHAAYVKPNWPYKRVAKIGNHIFYNERI